MTISIRNLDAALGAEVGGIDLSKPVAQGDIKAIEDAWCDRLVVDFRGQKLSDPQLIAFSRNFEDLDPPGPNPDGEPFNKGTSGAQRHFQCRRKRQADRQSRRRRKPFGTPT